ncbi:MAG: hypothetical protein DHS20C18_01770 [Saprospiraceae bacterium]|nr:MAG: hypothetical protein DHS20C18_01770 [Saprospiraceae bacterium]
MSERITPRMQIRMKKIRSMRRPDAEPFFHFPDLPNSERLTYQPLGYNNYMTLNELFAEDDSPFANPEFKELERIELYVVSLLEFARYSPRRCGQDWIIHLAETGTAVGVLHLYDFTKEPFGNRDQKCSIGFAIAAPFRRKGYALESIGNLLTYIFQHFEMIQVLAYTTRDNLPSQSLLKRLCFSPNDQDYDHPDHYAFFELKLEQFEMLLKDGEIWRQRP